MPSFEEHLDFGKVGLESPGFRALRVFKGHYRIVILISRKNLGSSVDAWKEHN